MATREELEEFAVMNGMYIHPDRDPDYFVTLLNSKGGKCPCDEYSICPCADAPINAQRAIQEDRHKEACCKCHFFVTNEYLKAWDMTIKTTPDAVPSAKPVETKWKVQTPQIKELLDVFNKANRLAEQDRFDEAADMLTELADNSECGMCQKLLSTERLHMDVLGSSCTISQDECEIEKQNMKTRKKRIENFLKQVDEYSVTGKIDGKEPDEESSPTGEDSAPVERKSNSYHTCLKTMPGEMPNAGALPEYETRVRFAIASKLCAKQGRNEPTSFQQELETYRIEHPEFFTRGE